MEDVIGQIGRVARGMWKHRWPGVLVAWVVAVAGVAAVLRIPDQYEASARIYVDTQSILKPLMSGLAVQPDIDQQVVILSRTLLSRPNLEKLVRMADVDLKGGARKQDELIAELGRTLKIQTTGRDNLYTVSYRDPNPEVAKRVVQSLVSIFVESGLGANRKDADAAKQFLNEQIKSYQVRLEEAEARLKAFKLRNLELQADGKDTATRITGLSAELDAAKLQLREAEDSRKAAKEALEHERAQTSDLSTQSLVLEPSAQALVTPEIDARIEAQKKNLDVLLQRFTDAHPDVTSARRLISELEEQKKKELAELRRAAASAPVANPAAPALTGSLAQQELTRVLATAEIQVAAMRARVAEYTSRLQQAKQALKVAPQLEAEAAQLNRDYEVHKRNYEDLVKRRESAMISSDLEVASGLADFRVIDPPRASTTPVAPNRLMLMPLALVAALGAGLFAAFALSRIRPVFHQPADLRSKISLPLIGVVSLVRTDADRRRERGEVMRFCFASGSLVALFAVGLTAMSLLTHR